MTFDEWKIKYDGDIVNVADVFFSYERGADSETCYDELYWILKKAFNAGKKNAPKWHYPSKGEFPEEFKLVAVSIKGFDYTTTGLYIPEKDGGIVIRTVDKWRCQIPYHADEYKDNEDIVAWQYLPEPPKEE